VLLPEGWPPPDDELPEARLPPDIWVHLCVVDEPGWPAGFDDVGFGDAVADAVVADVE
jgi:hypothetical protein